MARRGVRFTKAFTNAGVCAPSRTGIITGMMPTSIGANHMRSRARVPNFIRGFPYYLREAGYYCTNNVKTDYNIADFEAGWNESSNKAHWRNRPDPNQPFFSVFNYTGTHESRAFADPESHEKQIGSLTDEQRQDPKKLDVPPIYPDTPLTRRDQADYHELATELDYWIAGKLRELEADGLMEKTIVFFCSDHGDGLPRAKRWLYDSGTNIPLIVMIPEAYRVAGQGRPGNVDDQLISGIDLGPTVLNLGGVKRPEHMEGRAFLGQGLTPPRRYVYGARDRMDERYDLIRTVRDHRFLYVRNYMPWKPYNQPIGYAEQEATMKELRRLVAEGALPENCRWFTTAPKPVEEMYDCDADPWQQRNLAGDPRYAEVLERLRGEHFDWVTRTRDLHLLPEALLAQGEAQLGSRWAILQGEEGAARLRRIHQAALGQEPTSPATDEVVRYWAAQQAGFKGRNEPLIVALNDPSVTVRVAAAHWLGLKGQAERALPVLASQVKNPNPWVVLAALTALDEMGEAARPALHSLGDVSGKDGEYPGRVLNHIRENLK
jgi:uncharacterized sulfatase